MDPTTVFSTVSAAIELTGVCYEFGNFLSRMRQKYKKTNNTLGYIETESRIFQVAVSHIREWLESQTPTSLIRVQLESAYSALNLINESRT
ncbi:hypothetical protein MMC21_004834 [Puttea exsequens]|nr:hypothetical protein [Puttea exsequens]